MAPWLHDLRFALRSLSRQPGFTAVAVLTLALGIGAGTAIFSVVHAVVLAPLRFAHPEELYRLSDVYRGSGDSTMSPANFLDLRRGVTQWRDLVATTWESVNLAAAGGVAAGGEDGRENGADSVQRVHSAPVTAGFFPLLGVEPAAGRAFRPAEDAAGAEPTVILGYGLAARFAAAAGSSGDVAAVLGTRVRLNSVPHTVIGVAPPGFDFPFESELWVPFRWDPANPGPRGSRNLFVFGRLAPGAAPAAAEAELHALFARIAEAYPAGNTDYSVRATPLDHWVVPDDSRRSLLLLAGAVLLVLLIACANVANLLLARGEARHREFAVRAALGAGRAAVVRQFVLEALLTALAGGAAGVGVAVLGTRLLVDHADGLPRATEVGVDGTALLFALALSLASGLAVALVPAWRHARGDVWEGLRSSRGVAGDGGWTRRALVVAETALAVVLVLGAGLLIESFWKLNRVELGVDAGRVLGARLELPEAAYPDAAAVEGFFADLDREVAALPGVEAVGHVNRLPFAAGNLNITTMRVDGHPQRESSFVELRLVSPDYFATTGLRLIAGRGFTAADREDAPPTVVVNQRLAGQLFPAGDALGSRLDPGWGDFKPEVVGVVEDLRDFGPHRDVPPAFYLAEAANPGARDRALVVRTAGDPLAMVRVDRCARSERRRSVVASREAVSRRTSSRQATPREEKDSLSPAAASSATVEPPAPSGTTTGSQPKPPSPRGGSTSVPATRPCATTSSSSPGPAL